MNRAFRALAFSLLGLIASIALAPRTLASDIRIDFDPQKTTIGFTLGASMHEVQGVFQLKSGSIRFGRQSGAASGSLIVDAASGDSGNGSRDSKMKSDILETAHFPEIVFTPSGVTGNVPEQGSATVQVRGILRIHGAEHEVMLTVSLTVTGSAFELTTKFPVPYVTWGMKDPSVFVLRVGKQVDVSVKAAGTVRNVR